MGNFFLSEAFLKYGLTTVGVLLGLWFCKHYIAVGPISIGTSMSALIMALTIMYVLPIKMKKN